MKRRTWLVSDWHFYHKNMLRGGKIANRPFDTLEEMHETIIARHNAVVRNEDEVICLGDVTLERNPNSDALRIVTHLNGRSKILLLGNHDHYSMEQYHSFAGFTKIAATMQYAGLALSHIPIHPAQFGRFKGNVHGHTHDNHVQRYQFDIDHTECSPVINTDLRGLSKYRDPLAGREAECCNAGVVAHVSPDPRYLNVCVEPLSYTPILLEDAIARLEKAA